MLARREVGVLVHDAVLLEGINFTLPEIQTLMEGITVGGHKLSDQQIALNQVEAWNSLFESVEQGSFKLNDGFACALHSIAAKEEALEWGKFRSGQVTIAGTRYMPPSAKELPEAFNAMVEKAQKVSGIYERAIFVFLSMACNQFFYDVNKRMGRFMMNGLLLSEGYPAINLPASKKIEFNRLMLSFYESGEMGPMTSFMLSCLDQRHVDIMCE